MGQLTLADIAMGFLILNVIVLIYRVSKLEKQVKAHQTFIDELAVKHREYLENMAAINHPIFDIVSFNEALRKSDESLISKSKGFNK